MTLGLLVRSPLALVLVPIILQTLRSIRRLVVVRKELGCSLVVKLGGSAVTKKAQFETLDAKSLDVTASALAASPWASRTTVIHGAGSFGHFQAAEHGVSKGVSDARFSWRGFAETRSSVTRLNAHVVSALLRAGLPACGLPPFPRWQTRAKQLVRDGVEEVRHLLERGLLPVLHGDAVMDQAQGSAILSGDALMVALCKRLRPERAVFLTDVPGVFDRPPKQPGATLLSRIVVAPHSGEIVEVHAAGGGVQTGGPQTSTAAHDVTGGLAAKLSAASVIAASGIPVYIVEVGSAHAKACLCGESPQICTLIEVAPK